MSSDVSVLAEQTASMLNVNAQKAGDDARSMVPRKASTASASSVNSIQRHTVHRESSAGDRPLPEWKRRLISGEDVGGNGGDLFGPTRLEGMFKQPSAAANGAGSQPVAAVEETPKLLWSMPDKYQSMRATRPRIQAMSVLPEENEDTGEAAQESRKPSVTTQDFLNEATKIMQIIRQKGRPRSALSSLDEHREERSLDPDSILDLEIMEEITTIDNFSRPPSRDGSVRKQKPQEVPKDPGLITHLQKYQEASELGSILNLKLESLHLDPEGHASDNVEAVPSSPNNKDQEQDESISEPPNIRIRNAGIAESDQQKPLLTAKEHASLPTQGSSEASTKSTVPTTSSSASSAHKGRIPPGTISVPNQVGVMTFDHSSKSWVRGKTPQCPRDSGRKSNSEGEDPFCEIPDLSMDEIKERSEKSAESTEKPLQDKKNVQNLDPPSHPQSKASTLPSGHDANLVPHFTDKENASPVTPEEPIPSGAEDKSCDQLSLPEPGSELEGQYHDEEVEHEIRIHDGRASEAPASPQRSLKKARAVTVAFSSPLTSAIGYQDEHAQPSELSVTYEDLEFERQQPRQKRQKRCEDVQAPGYQKPIAPLNHQVFSARRMQKIEEQDEENKNPELSIVHFNHTYPSTPEPVLQMSRPRLGREGLSMIHLTPLSEFTLHQTDQRCHADVSYIDRRARPGSLRQAHGTLALALDDLMRAITNSESDELDWEQLRRLDLDNQGLTQLHRLEEFCTSIEELHISGNQVGQLEGIPSTVRTLSAQSNRLSSLTSWGHLYNLQYLDVSGNGLEDLHGIAYLVHLREIKANGNCVRDVSGVFGLDSLLHLELCENRLESVDFRGAELKRLHYLDLSCNQLADVENCDALPALETVRLDGNKLSDIEGLEGCGATLYDLHISRNQIEAVDLSHLPALRVLHLDENRIHTIDGLEAARHLDVLSLRDQSDSPNILNTVFASLNECRKLYLSSNVVPAEGLALPSRAHLNLKYLELASCSLTALPKEFGQKLPNCRALNLNFNAIKDLKHIRGCTHLNKLLVSGNRLDRLRRTCRATHSVPTLKKIDLRDNPLTVGFYAPMDNRPRAQMPLNHDSATYKPYSLPRLDANIDTRWIKRLDELTATKRGIMELLLAHGCPKLTEVNGLPFDRVAAASNEFLSRLITLGVASEGWSDSKTLEVDPISDPRGTTILET